MAMMDDNPNVQLSNLEAVVGGLSDRARYEYIHNPNRTFGDLTDLLISRVSPVVTQQVTGLLEKTYVSPYTSFLLPIRKLGPFESINVKWTEVNFNPGIAPQMEVLGVGRYFTHNKTRRGARAVRRGAAVQIEAGFFMTPEGREDWRMQIEQLVTVIQNTNEYDVLLTLLQVPMRTASSPTVLSAPYGVNVDLDFEKRFELERDMFGLVNKVPDSRGFNSLVTNLRTAMARSGVVPDAMIVPPYMIGYYYMNNRDMWNHASAGQDTLKNREHAVELATDSGFRSHEFQGMKLIDTYIYRASKGARESACDLLTTTKQIGEFYPMEISMIARDANDFEHFSGKHRNIRIFNEECARIVPVYFKEAIDNCLRWTQSETGNVLDAEAHRGLENDMFVTNGGKLCEYWGEMQENYLPDAHVAHVVATIRNALKRKNILDATNPEYVSTVTNLMGTGDQEAAFEAIEHVIPKVKTVRGEIDGNTFDDIIKRTFFNTRITRGSMQIMNNNDIYVPVNIILARPFMRYNVSSVVMMKAGRETGETIIGQNDFMVSSPSQDRMIEASYVYYGKAIVRNSRNVVVAPNVFIQGYVGGNNVTFVTHDTVESEIKKRGGVFDSKESLVAMMVPVTSEVHKHNFIDYRGTDSLTRANKNYHDSAEFYSAYFGVEDADLATPEDSFLDYEDMSYAANSLCWLGHMEYGPEYKYYNLNTGHLGPHTYDQCNLTRKEGIFAPAIAMARTSKHMY